MTGLTDQSLGAFIEAVSADAPAPGAGAAAAVCLALAAACAGKAFAISARHRGEARLAQAADESRRIARAALGGAERDAADFTALLHARPGDHDAERALRADGEALLILTAALQGLVEEHQDAVIGALAGDLAAARALSAASEAVQRRDLAELKDPD